jgi:hypothetical protein
MRQCFLKLNTAASNGIYQCYRDPYTGYGLVFNAAEPQLALEADGGSRRWVFKPAFAILGVAGQR